MLIIVIIIRIIIIIFACWEIRKRRDLMEKNIEYTSLRDININE